MTDITKPGMVPNMVFFTKGVGTHKAKLQSFEFALREAGIEIPFPQRDIHIKSQAK